MPKWIEHLITESDNHTYDAIRIMAVFAMLEFMIKSLHNFDPISFGQGFGYMAAGVGVALALKPETKAADGTP